ncbi:MAG: Unknown protein [uncultured Sulfurovum sp.]|uniref:Caspase family p20 domain-containing protein n=1 Tax=uncultured Sulfurovum sp. TaxID=269237 RepID=A0A6S6UCY4_9BACT|nr:MAG: Unknown protein [uncultured Sulfurovum sp.]
MRAIILLGVLCSLLFAQPREALLIGNHNYVHISDLDNPSKNLQRLKTSLEEVDFKVKVETDLNSENLENAIEQFKNRLARNSKTIGFLYYTGHGCQVDYQGYLVPTNVDTQQKLKIKYNALNINQMLENLKGAGNKVNLLFLDACRDVPTGTKGGTKGLSQPLEKPIGTLLVYATEAGKVANDNAKFINALISNIKKPNQNLESLGSSISRTVAKKSGFKQIPEVYAKLLPENLVLKGIVPPPPPVVQPVIVTPKPHRVDLSTTSVNSVTLNGLTYQNQPFTKLYTWQEAKDYCKELTLDGYSNWRLPNRKELNAIRTKNKIQGQEKKYYIRPEFVQNLRGWGYFWTSEEKDSSGAWSVDFYLGSDGWNYKTGNDYALCVR